MLDVFNKELVRKYKEEPEMNTKTEMKNIVEGIKSRLDAIEEQISELEDRIMEITDAEKKKENNKKK